jgi:ribosomal protein S27AE
MREGVGQGVQGILGESTLRLKEMLNPQLRNRECQRCEEGNRLAKHIRTELKRPDALGPDEDCVHIAIFLCAKCGHSTREAFEMRC